jgi:hypothetical protein
MDEPRYLEKPGFVERSQESRDGHHEQRWEMEVWQGDRRRRQKVLERRGQGQPYAIT